MEGQPQLGNSQYQYQTAWSRLVRRNTLADVVPISSPSIVVSSQLPLPLQRPPHIDLLPILLPQHSSYHQAQLAQYNRLITSGRASRLQTPPLPPLVSTQHIQAVPGSRTSVGGGTTARTNKSSSRGGHGNKEPRKSSKGERALVTEEDSTKMPAKLPPRPNAQHHNSNFSVQSSSVPSTPHQHARKFSFESREPSPTAINGHSPRSAYSESNITLPSKFPSHRVRGGCRYETAMAHTKRRMPYTDKKMQKLDPADLKGKLSEDEERILSTDMRELYDRLLPTPESEKKRESMVQKLEKLFNDAWPGKNTQVHVFGSSGNLLCTDDSDVDICITTDMKEMEAVCIIADLLAKNGMEKVICVSTAKVPIVKIWDPELGLACDMNVNNTLALENTRMIKTYVQIDPRVRPLAMIIKHWTKKRIVNDAAFGGTLSSYTWICMIINFLQSRTPPILPALHQRPHMKLAPKDGVESAFADDLDALNDFGQHNKETLGELLFQFFRFYGHEFDYDKLVISVRSGKQISKVEKRWHLTNNNQLCVEEPFNVDRNLGNTADDSSFTGLQLELRRAFDLISQGKLEECCEQYEFPKEEPTLFQRPAQNSKPVQISISHSNSQSSRGGRGGSHRGGRRNNNNSSNGNRRASSGAFENNPSYMGGAPANMSAQDAWLQRQAQAQLHNDLYNTYSVLQAQENSLRLQLYAQGLQNQAYAQQQAQSNGSAKSQGTDRNRTNSFDQPPLSAPIRPEMFLYPLQPYTGQQMYGYATPSTNPSSPSLSSAVPVTELRRSMHRSGVTNGPGQGAQSNSTLRSHSQPAARTGPSPLAMQGQLQNPGLGIYQSMRQPHVPNFIADENLDPNHRLSRPAGAPQADSIPKEYVGYYVNDHTPNAMRRPSAAYSAQPLSIPTFGDMSGHGRRRLSTDQLPQSVLDRLKRPSRSPSPLGHDRSYSTGAHSAPGTVVPSQQGISSSNLRMLNSQAPLVVNGSNPVPVMISTWQAAISEGSLSEDPNSDTLVGSLDSNSNSQVSGTESDISDSDLPGQLTPRDPRLDARLEPPMVVNGSRAASNATNSSHNSPSSKAMDVAPTATQHSNGLVPVDQLNGPLRLSPNSIKNRLVRNPHNGGMSPLDIGLSQNENLRDDLHNLSPVYETRTPSPTATRNFHLERKTNGMNGMSCKPVDIKVIEKPEASKPVQKPAHKIGFAPGQLPKQAINTLKSNGHTRGSKSEGAPGTWQQIPKNKKKGQASEQKAAANGQTSGEKLPSKDVERKGG